MPMYVDWFFLFIMVVLQTLVGLPTRTVVRETSDADES